MARLDTPTLKKWLEGKILAQDPAIKVVMGRLEDTPDRMVNIRRGTGRGSQMEGLYESVMYQIDSRGKQGSLADAENIAEMIDLILLDGANNLFFEDCHILSTDWSGSGPQQVVIGDPVSRFQYQCNYVITSAKE